MQARQRIIEKQIQKNTLISNLVKVQDAESDFLNMIRGKQQNRAQAIAAQRVRSHINQERNDLIQQKIQVEHVIAREEQLMHETDRRLAELKQQHSLACVARGLPIEEDEEYNAALRRIQLDTQRPRFS